MEVAVTCSPLVIRACEPPLGSTQGVLRVGARANTPTHRRSTKPFTTSSRPCFESSELHFAFPEELSPDPAHVPCAVPPSALRRVLRLRTRSFSSQINALRSRYPALHGLHPRLVAGAWAPFLWSMFLQERS
jgi:hypothetical protein